MFIGIERSKVASGAEGLMAAPLSAFGASQHDLSMNRTVVQPLLANNNVAATHFAQFNIVSLTFSAEQVSSL